MKILLFFITLFISFCVYATKENIEPLDHIVAIINDAVIVESELVDAMQKIRRQLKAENTASPLDDILRKQVLEQLINKKLQLQLASQAGLNPSDEEIENTIQDIAKRNHLTVPQLYIELEKRGILRDEYRKNIHDEYIISTMQHQAIGQRITVSDQEVNDFMRSAAWLASTNKEYHLQDILIALPETPTPQDVLNAKKRAAALVEKLKNGANFREISYAESGSNKALQGGDLGFRKLPEIPSAFSALILQANAGDILGPIQAANGFHIIHVVEIRNVSAEGKSKDQQKQQVKKLIFERKYEEALQNWLTKIRSEAFINTNL